MKEELRKDFRQKHERAEKSENSPFLPRSFFCLLGNRLRLFQANSRYLKVIQAKKKKKQPQPKQTMSHNAKMENVHALLHSEPAARIAQHGRNAVKWQQFREKMPAYSRIFAPFASFARVFGGEAAVLTSRIVDLRLERAFSQMLWIAS